MKDYSVLDGMRKQTSEIIMQAFDKGYKQGYMDGKDEAYKNPVPTQDAYQRGLDDAWEAARIIYGMNKDTRLVTTAFVHYETVFDNYSASEAIAKIKEYEEKQNNSCSFCIHCEMCGWIEAHKNCGCDCFDDGKMQEDRE